MKELLSKLRRRLAGTSAPALPSASPKLIWAGIGVIVLVGLLIVAPGRFVRSAPAPNANRGTLGIGDAEAAWAPVGALSQSSTGSPDAPELINYQGELTDNAGNPLVSETKIMTFRIFPQQSGGDPLWSESHEITTDADGKFNVLLGALTPDLTNALAGEERWLEVEVAGETLSPRQRIGSVAYALHADRAATLSRPGFITTTVDSGDEAGSEPSMAIGADGLPVISYVAFGDLMVAHCNDLACTTSTMTALDSVGCEEPAIAIGADGLPVISYIDGHNRDLKAAHCNDLACTSATTTTVDSACWADDCSIAIGADGLAVISYFDDRNDDLRVAQCSDLACTAATTTTADSPGSVGWYPSIAIGTDGLPVIAYAHWYNLSSYQLRTAHCDNLACTAVTTATVDSTDSVGIGTSIAIGIDGLAVIAYYEDTWDNLRVAHCLDWACASATTGQLSSCGSVDSAMRTAVAIGADGLPVISYYHGTDHDLMVAHCSDVSCTSWTEIAVDSAGDVGRESAIAIGTDGLPIISYHDVTHRDLRAAHCSNRFCTPYVRP